MSFSSIIVSEIFAFFLLYALMLSNFNKTFKTLIIEEVYLIRCMHELLLCIF